MGANESNQIIEWIGIVAPIVAVVSILINIHQFRVNHKLERQKLEYNDKRVAISSVIGALSNVNDAFLGAKTWFEALGIAGVKANLDPKKTVIPVYQTLVNAVFVAPTKFRQILSINALFFTDDLDKALKEYNREILDKIPVLPLEDLNKLSSALDDICSKDQAIFEKVVEVARKSMGYKD